MRIKFILLFLVAGLVLNAQEKKSPSEILKNGIKFNFTEDGKNFTKIGVGTQIWARYIDLNPGTIGADGKPLSNDFDVSLRRTTFSFLTKFDKFTFFSMIGVSSQPNNKSIGAYNASKKNAEFFLYDVWGSYKVIPKHLTMGMGLNMYNGLSRYSSATSSGALSADVPTLATTGLLTNYQSARQLGIFATGKLGKLDYRVSLAKPFIANSESATNPVADCTYETETNNLGFKGYFTYQFWDQESNDMPFTKSTYIGTKKVLNLGFGFDYHPESTAKVDNEGKITDIYDKKHFAVDIFMDLPLGNNAALTFYTAAFKFDYGPNYLMSYGVMDTFKKGGIDEPQHGTGNAYNTQIGYLIPNKNKSAVRIQPYYTFTCRDFDALNNKALHHDIGSNFYFAGHKAKFGLEYQIRPVFNGQDLDTYKGMIIGKMAFSI
jgi:hypothetical protein